MKEYRKEIVILVIQLAMFYVYPIIVGEADPIGMVLTILLATLILSLLLGALSAKRWKYVYPLVIAVLFIPAVFIFYNDSALVYCVWYLVVSAISVLVGSLLRKVIVRN